MNSTNRLHLQQLHLQHFIIHCTEYLEKFESFYNFILNNPTLNPELRKDLLFDFQQEKNEKSYNEKSYKDGAEEIVKIRKILKTHYKEEYKKQNVSKEYKKYKKLKEKYNNFLDNIREADQKRGVTSEAPPASAKALSLRRKKAHPAPATAALSATTAQKRPLSAPDGFFELANRGVAPAAPPPSKDELTVATEDLLELGQFFDQAVAPSTQSYPTHPPGLHPAAAAPAAAAPSTHMSSSRTPPFDVHSPPEDKTKSRKPTEIIEEAGGFMKDQRITMEHLHLQTEQRRRFNLFLQSKYQMELHDYLYMLGTQESLKGETYKNSNEQLKDRKTTHGNSIFKTSAKHYQCGYNMLAIGIMQLHFINSRLYEETICKINPPHELIGNIKIALHPPDGSKPNFTLHQEELGQCLKKYFTENGNHLRIIDEYFRGFPSDLEKAARVNEREVYQVDSNLDQQTLCALASHLGIQLKFLKFKENPFLGDISSFIYADNPHSEHYDCVVHPSLYEIIRQEL